jgi:hypothetical protein
MRLQALVHLCVVGATITYERSSGGRKGGVATAISRTVAMAGALSLEEGQGGVEGNETAPTSTFIDMPSLLGPNFCFVSIGLTGHAVPLVRLAEEMMKRGYHASVATHDNLRELVEAVPGLEFLSLGPLPLSQDELKDRLARAGAETSGFRGLLKLLNDVYLPLALPLYEPLLSILQEADPDLLVLDIGTLGAADVAATLDVPFVLNSPTLLFHLDAWPSWLPAWGTGFSVHMSLLQRCLNFLFPRLLSVALTPPFMHINKLRRSVALPRRAGGDVS